MSRIAITATALAAAMLFGTPAAADETRVWPVGDTSYHIYFGSDLNTAQGRAVALGVVEKAAAKLCRNMSTTDRDDVCVAKIVSASMHSPKGQMLALAVVERGRVQLAAK